MSLRGDDAPIKGEGGRVPTHVKNKEGRVFIATPQLLEKADMRPIFDGDEEEIKKINSNLDILAKKGPPSHVRAENGRVFIATPELIERGDMEFLYDYEPEKTGKKNADDRFVLSKATKQRIQDEGLKLFGVEIALRSLKEMREDFTKLEELHAQKVIYVAGVKTEFGVDLNVNDSVETLEEQVRDLVLADSSKEDIAGMALEEFGIIMDIEVDIEVVRKNFKILADSDEDFLEEIRAEQKANANNNVKGAGDDDQGNDNPDKDPAADADSDSSDESGQATDSSDDSGNEPDNKTGDQQEG